MSEFASRARRAGRPESLLEVTAVRGEAVFAAARRHGRFVGLLRVALPLVAVLGGIGFVAAIYVVPKFKSAFSFGKIEIQSNALVMDAPKVSGFSGTHQSYELSAQRATQSLENPKVVTLETIAARLGLESEATANVGAGRGIYDSQHETLRLQDGISIKTANGYQATLEDANVDLKNGTFASDHPIELRSSDSTIRGNKIEISDGGRRIMVTQGVSMTLGASLGAAVTAATGNRSPGTGVQAGDGVRP